MVICHLHYQNRYSLRVVQTLEVIGPVNRNLVTRPVTIEEAGVPPLIRNTERPGAARQPKRGTLNGILILSGILIPLTFFYIQN